MRASKRTERRFWQVDFSQILTNDNLTISLVGPTKAGETPAYFSNISDLPKGLFW